MENGEDVQIQELLERSQQHLTGGHNAQVLQHVPTLYQLEEAIRALQSMKAPGLDGLGAEILHAKPQEAAKKIFPIVMKSAIREQGI